MDPQWALQCPVCTQTSVIKLFTEMCDKHHGPRQYLEATYNTEDAKIGFATRLLMMLPLLDTEKYQLDMNVPEIIETQRSSSPCQLIHISGFSFSKSASMKPPPGKGLALQLVDQYLADGFVTSGDPLLITVLSKLPGLRAPWDQDFREWCSRE